MYKRQILICSGIEFGDPEVFEHEGSGATGGSGAAAFFNANLQPVAIADGVPLFGLPPLAVQFSSAGSFDPEGGALLYFWNFGDGSPISNEANPLHVYNGNQLRTATLTVRDVSGAEDTDSVDVDTRDVIAVSDFANVSYSADGGVNLIPAVGIPAGNTRSVLGANGFIFAFRSNPPNTDVYRSADGLNYVQVGVIAANIGSPGHAILGHNGRIIITSSPVGLQNTIAYSDDDGVTWALVVVAIGVGQSSDVCRMTNPGQLMVGRPNILGGGNPYEFFLSINNGLAWAPTAGGFGDTAQEIRVQGAAGNRVIARGSMGIGEVRTSDDQGATWQLRQGLVSNQPRGLWARGTRAVVEDAFAANQPFWSINAGTAWANFNTLGGNSMMQMVERNDGWFAAALGGVYFAAALPFFALRGGPAVNWRSIATLRDQET